MDPLDSTSAAHSSAREEDADALPGEGEEIIYGPLGHFRRLEESESSGVCLACGETLSDLNESELLRHLGGQHPEFPPNGILTIHETQKDDDDGDAETTTTVLLVGKEGAVFGDEDDDDDESQAQDLSSYFKESSHKDVLECKLCGVSLQASEILLEAHILEAHQVHQVPTETYMLQEEEDDDETMSNPEGSQNEEDDLLLLEEDLHEEEQEEEVSRPSSFSAPQLSQALLSSRAAGIHGASLGKEVRCVLCEKRYHTAGGSTTVMLRHLKRDHPDDLAELQSDMQLSGGGMLPHKRTSRSVVWAYFLQSGKANSVTCRLCGKSYSSNDSSTGIMLRHLRKQHDKEYKQEMSRREAEDKSPGPEGVLPTKKLPRKNQSSRSSVWSYFTRCGNNSVKCNICSKDYSNIGGSTSAMIRHLRKAHGDEEPLPEKKPVVQDEDDPDDEVYTVVVKEESGEGAVSERILLEGIASEGSENKFSDVTIICKDGQVVRSHRLILAATSLFMYEILKGLPETDESPVISAPDFDGDVVKAFLDKIYFGGETLTEGMLDVVNHFQFRVNFIQYPDRKVQVFEESPMEEGEASSLIAVVQSCEPSGGIPVEETILFRKRSPIWNYFCRQDPDVASCLECNASVGSKQHSTSSMIKHLQRHHEELYKKFSAENSKPAGSKNPSMDPQKIIQSKTCSICSKVFSSRNKMAIHHRAVHLQIKGYTCDICGKSYSRVDSLKDHVSSTHSTDGPSFLCKFCGKTFKRRATRFRHERFHRNDRRHACSYCPKKFFTSQTLRNHERTHTGEKPFQCNECSRRFTMQHQLTTHLRVHTGDKPYHCKYCSDTFKHVSAKNKHICPNMPPEQTQIVTLGLNRRKALSSSAASSSSSLLSQPNTLIEETTEVMLPITVNDGGEIATTTTYHAVVKESVLKDISQQLELSSTSRATAGHPSIP
ncbi:Zinc finger protein 845like [Caligus rogercresseyi]|uniref:Zinc finger protein 845like n=1 Tax=Caligus rogercresseyi TaxID=217165 RepID=A0A7T8QVI8_CALRO|nr:Zinc finger protein 845like [Caligus rogercresseyi]